MNSILGCSDFTKRVKQIEEILRECNRVHEIPRQIGEVIITDFLHLIEYSSADRLNLYVDAIAPLFKAAWLGGKYYQQRHLMIDVFSDAFEATLDPASNISRSMQDDPWCDSLYFDDQYHYFINESSVPLSHIFDIYLELLFVSDVLKKAMSYDELELLSQLDDQIQVHRGGFVRSENINWSLNRDVAQSFCTAIDEKSEFEKGLLSELIEKENVSAIFLEKEEMEVIRFDRLIRTQPNFNLLKQKLRDIRKEIDNCL